MLRRCELSLQHKLQLMTWEDLLTTKEGRDVGKGLVTALINQQISQQISVRGLSSIYRQLSYVQIHSSRLTPSVTSYNLAVLTFAVRTM